AESRSAVSAVLRPNEPRRSGLAFLAGGRAAQTRCDARASPGRIARDRRSPGTTISRSQQGMDDQCLWVARRGCARDSTGLAAAAGGGRLRAADRMRQRVEPTTCSRGGPSERDGGAVGVGRAARAITAPVVDRKPAALAPGRRIRVSAGLLGDSRL